MYFEGRERGADMVYITLLNACLNIQTSLTSIYLFIIKKVLWMYFEGRERGAGRVQRGPKWPSPASRRTPAALHQSLASEAARTPATRR